MRLLLFLLGLGSGAASVGANAASDATAAARASSVDAAVSIRGSAGALGGFGGAGAGAGGRLGLARRAARCGRRDGWRVVARHRLDAADARRHESADGQRLVEGARVGEE